MIATVKGPVKVERSKTGPQVLTRPVEEFRGKAVLTESYQGTLTYAKIREMRKDPTISMVRQLIVAPALMAEWTFKGTKKAPKGAVEFIREQLEELRGYLVRTCLFGCIDYGWQSFEKVFGVEDDKVVLAKMKALLPDYTDILVDERTGAFRGLREVNWTTGMYQFVNLKKSFVHSFDVEGTYWYGHSYMCNAEDPYDQWGVANDANVRYDTKIDGSHWVVHYPMGVSTVNGEDKDNEEIALEVLAALQSSGGIAVPKKVEEFIDGLDRETPNAWVIELISDKGASQTSFLERMAYLDNLKVRAFGFPERSILEGKYGTKAEAETHADFAVTNILLRSRDLIRDLNWHLVDQLIAVNYGPEYMRTVRICPGSIGAENKKFLRDVYMKIIADSKGFTQEVSRMDLGAVRELLMVPENKLRDKESSLFEDELKKLEESANKPDPEPPEELEDGLLDESGSGESVRQDEHKDVGRPRQFRGPGDDSAESRLGDSTSGREDRRQAEGQPVSATS